MGFTLKDYERYRTKNNLDIEIVEGIIAGTIPIRDGLDRKETINKMYKILARLNKDHDLIKQKIQKLGE
tara:strand:+ start:24275 stop:24481 length:207 start_codon:yes stop_codon:yes gene_type:complete